MKPLALLLISVAPLIAAPIPYYKMDDPSGSTTKSETDTRPASLIGSPQLQQAGKIGSSVALTGNDYLSLSTPVTFSASEDFTIMAWIHPDLLKSGSHSQAAIICGSTGSNHYLRLQTTSLALKFDGSSITVPLYPAFTTGSWQHFAIRRKAGNITVFHNGVTAGSGTHPEPFAFNAIGAKNITGTANHFHGRIDEFQVYQNTALSDADILGISRQYDGRVSFSAIGCGPYNHPLKTNGSIETNSNAFWSNLPAYNTANSGDYYLRRDDGALKSYLEREANLAPQSAFMVHLGDIFTGKRNDWPEERYEDVANLLKTSEIPFFTVIGDNEWVDHRNPNEAESHWLGHFSKFHAQFPPLPFSNSIAYQPEYEKNFSFSIENILFTGLSIPSGIGKIPTWLKTVSANRDWLERHLPPQMPQPNHHWKLDDIGNNATDSAGGNSGSHTNITVNQPAKIGTGYQFQGTNSIQLNNPISINGSEDFSITGWVKPNTIVNGGGNPGAILLGDTANKHFLRIDPSDIHFKANNSTHTISIPNGIFQSDSWQHFALIRSKGVIAAYQNGTLLGAESNHFQPFTFDHIGSKGATQYFDGCLDDLRVYLGTALGTREIAALALKSAHWQMDDSNAELEDVFGVTPATTLNGGVSGANGQIGNAIELNGSSDFVLAQPIGFNAEDDFTIAAWVRPYTVIASGPASPSAVVIGEAGNANYIRINNDHVRVKLNGAFRDIPTTPSFTIGQWQHFSITRTNGSLNVLRNGKIVGSHTPTNPQHGSFNRIGSKNGLQFFNGRIDSLLIENHAMSPAEIAKQMGNAPKSAVIFAQGSYTTPGKYGLLRSMMERSADSFSDDEGAKPILFLQADLHTWIDSKDAPAGVFDIPNNLRYVVLNSIDSTHPPVQITVTQDRSPNNAFIFNRRGSPETANFLTQNQWIPNTNQLSGYEHWRCNYPLLSGSNPNDDFDNDTIQNFLEYAFGGNPQIPDTAALLPELRNNALHFHRAAPDLTYQLQTSTDLEYWITSTNPMVDMGDGTFAITIPTGSALQFTRMCVR